MTKNGPKVFITDYCVENIEKLEKQDIYDYYIKEIPTYVIGNYEERTNYMEEEIFYKLKNPNFQLCKRFILF